MARQLPSPTPPPPSPDPTLETDPAPPQPKEKEVSSASQEPDSGGYVSGTCKELRAMGLSHFSPGDPNYTARRDRDGDGIACE